MLTNFLIEVCNYIIYLIFLKVYSTGSLPRNHQNKPSPVLVKRGMHTGDFDITGEQLPHLSPQEVNIQNSPTRRDPNDPLPGTGVNGGPSPGLQGLQGLSGSRLMGTPGAPRISKDYNSVPRIPDMYGGSIYQGPIDEEEEHYNGDTSTCTDQSMLYETTPIFYGTQNNPDHNNEKSSAADRTNPLISHDIKETLKDQKNAISR